MGIAAINGAEAPSKVRVYQANFREAVAEGPSKQNLRMIRLFMHQIQLAPASPEIVVTFRGVLGRPIKGLFAGDVLFRNA
jgi:hypothetical protein